MSENSDLRERAKAAVKVLGINDPTNVVIGEVIIDLLAALDAAEREERERCEKLAEGCQDLTGHPEDELRWSFNHGCKCVAAAIRREGGKG